jgi:hypothetical protein
MIDFGTCYHVGGGVWTTLGAEQIARVLRPGGLFVRDRASHSISPTLRSFGRRLPGSRRITEGRATGGTLDDSAPPRTGCPVMTFDWSHRG